MIANDVLSAAIAYESMVDGITFRSLEKIDIDNTVELKLAISHLKTVQKAVRIGPAGADIYTAINSVESAINRLETQAL